MGVRAGVCSVAALLTVFTLLRLPSRSLAERLEEANDQNCSFLPVNGGK